MNIINAYEYPECKHHFFDALLAWKVSNRVGLKFPPPFLSKFISLSLQLKWGVFWNGCHFQVCGLKILLGPHCLRQVIGAKYADHISQQTHHISVSPLFIFDHHHPPCHRALCLSSIDAMRQWAFAIANPRGIHINQPKTRWEERRLL